MLQSMTRDDAPDVEPLPFFAVVPDSFMDDWKDSRNDDDERSISRFGEPTGRPPLVSGDRWSF